MSISRTTPAPGSEIQSAQDRIIDAVTVRQQEVLEAVETTGRALFEGLNNTGHEIADFLAERIRQDLDTQQALLRCRSFGEFRDIQAGYLKTALDQFGSEASRLIQLSGAVAAKSLERKNI